MTRIEELVKKVHKAKGRYHTQLAMCDLYDVCGLPNFRPGSEPVQPECLHDETERLGAIWMHCTQCGKKWADDEIVPTTQPVQPEQEPVAWWDAKLGVFDEKHFDQLQPLYTSPPQRQPLTHEQRLDLLTAFEEWKHDWNAESILIDMVEAAHGIGDKT
jgi:ribosomal protein L37AE/L43A